jgi:hypothetical protein
VAALGRYAVVIAAPAWDLVVVPVEVEDQDAVGDVALLCVQEAVIEAAVLGVAAEAQQPSSGYSQTMGVGLRALVVRPIEDQEVH